MSATEYQPIIIIGAARSGTNILRDCLASLDGFDTWPCDEINYIWRHGNRAYPNDEFPPELASESVKGYLKSCFDRQAQQLGCRYLVEKTTANSLRLEFVRECFPNAKYIVIYRNGFDSIASAMIRWRAPLDVKYIARKARYVPWADVPYYGMRYLSNRLSKLVSKQKTLANWGPKPAGELGSTLVQRAAIQWAACVRSTKDSLDRLDRIDVVEIYYEDFVKDPVSTVQKLLDELGIQHQPGCVEQLKDRVHVHSVNKGKSTFSLEQITLVKGVIGTQLARLGYKID